VVGVWQISDTRSAGITNAWMLMLGALRSTRQMINDFNISFRFRKARHHTIFDDPRLHRSRWLISFRRSVSETAIWAFIARDEPRIDALNVKNMAAFVQSSSRTVPQLVQANGTIRIVSRRHFSKTRPNNASKVKTRFVAVK